MEREPPTKHEPIPEHRQAPTELDTISQPVYKPIPEAIEQPIPKAVSKYIQEAIKQRIQKGKEVNWTLIHSRTETVGKSLAIPPAVDEPFTFPPAIPEYESEAETQSIKQLQQDTTSQQERWTLHEAATTSIQPQTEVPLAFPLAQRECDQ